MTHSSGSRSGRRPGRRPLSVVADQAASVKVPDGEMHVDASSPDSYHSRSTWPARSTLPRDLPRRSCGVATRPCYADGRFTRTHLSYPREVTVAPRRLATPSSVNAAIKQIADVMRRANYAGALQYVPELSWILFLRILDQREELEAEEAEALGVGFSASLESPYR